MKEIFFKYSKEKLKKMKAEVLKDCIYVLDANSLLDAYRLTKKTREDFLSKLEILSEKNLIVLPYQVGKEFTKNRKNVIKIKIDEQGRSKKLFEKALNEIKNITYYKNDKTLIEEIEKNVNNITREMKNSENVTVKFLDEEDEILNKILKIFEKKIVGKLEESQLEKIKKEGKIRFEEEIPPGYEDNKKINNKYGDLIIWKNLIAIAKESNKNILFVSNDNKSDWIEKNNKNEMTNPRIELLEEMFLESKKKFWQLDTYNFIKEITQKFKLEKSEEALEEIKELSINNDEKIIKSLNICELEIDNFIQECLQTMNLSIPQHVKDQHISNLLRAIYAIEEYDLEILRKIEDTCLNKNTLENVERIKNKLKEIENMKITLINNLSD